MTNEQKAARARELAELLRSENAYFDTLGNRYFDLSGDVVDAILPLLAECADLLDRQASDQAKLRHYDEIMAADIFDRLDVIALQRFKVEPSDSNIWGWCVKAGDGDQELYKGRKSDCEAVARRLIGAFLDGTLVGTDLIIKPQPLAKEPT